MKKLSINYTVLLPLILLFIITAIVTSLLFFMSHSDNIENQIALYQDMALKQAVIKLDGFMEKPHLMNASLKMALESDTGLYDNLPEMRKTILRYLSLYPSVMAGGLGIEKNGNFIAAGRHINGGFDSAIHESEISPTYEYHKLDDQGNPAELISSRESYNLKERSWYKKGAETGAPGWSSVYTFAGRSSIGLTAILPIKTENELMGVVQSAFTLNYISDFLDVIPMRGDHRIFIFDDSQKLIGASGEVSTLYKDNEGKLQRVGWENIDDPIILSAQSSGAIQKSLDEENHVHFESEGQIYYLRTLAYSGEYGLDWIIAVADLKSDFTGELESAFTRNLFISLMATLLLLIIGIIVLRKLINPVRELNKAVKTFSQDYQVIGIEKKGPTEIRELMSGFHSMSRQINQMMSRLQSTVDKKTVELEKSRDRIKTLSGLVPICAQCKKIRDDKGFWNNLESYIESHTDALFSHGLCQDCANKLYGSKSAKKKK